MGRTTNLKLKRWHRGRDAGQVPVQPDPLGNRGSATCRREEEPGGFSGRFYRPDRSSR